MTTLNSRLQLALINRKKGRNLLQKGFTLVELMIVVVIVGILSAVALPSFLSQSVKAKGTEGKSDISAIIKNTAAEFQSGGGNYIAELLDSTKSAAPAAGVCDNLGGRAAANTKKFDYTCSIDTSNVLTVTATGDGNDTSLGTMTIVQTVDLDTGVITLVPGSTCKVFGGTKTTTPCT